jgi:hypothetical protein
MRQANSTMMKVTLSSCSVVLDHSCAYASSITNHNASDRKSHSSPYSKVAKDR